MTSRHYSFSPCANVECPTSFCTLSSVCEDGACVPTSTLHDGTPCDDGDPTTAFDACHNGVCVGSTVATDSTSYTLQDLHPGRAYSVQVQAYNSDGGGPISDAVYGETLEAPPSQPAVDVQAEVLSATRVRLTWGEPPLDTHNGLLLGYEVWAAEQGEEPVLFATLNHDEFTVTNLKPYTEYDFFVTTYNSAGGSGPSTSVRAQTEQGKPEAPVQVHAEEEVTDKGEALTVHWQPPYEPHGIVTKYTVYYQE